MNYLHDSLPPGAFRGTGYWVNQAWYSMWEEKRLKRLEREKYRYFGHGDFRPFHLPRPRSVCRTQKYGPGDVCPTCKERQMQVRGECQRCYVKRYSQKKRLDTARALGVI